MSFASAAIANSFLDLAKQGGSALTPMQLQKLVYFSHGWHLAFDQGPLSAEHAQAWRWGPVFPELYHALKRWGGDAVSEPVRVMRAQLSDDGYQLVETIPTVPESTPFSPELISRVWTVYGTMSGSALSRLSHDPDGPWHKIRTESRGVRGIDIPDVMIADYFKAKLDANG